MPLPAYWSINETISNGSCGYYALAQIFIKMINTDPDYINNAFFDSSNMIYQPAQTFLCQTFDIELRDFNQVSLRSAINLSLTISQPETVAKIAPAFFILIMTHYRDYLRPLRTAYQHRQAELSYAHYFENIDKLFLQCYLELGSPTGGLSQNAEPLLKEAYLIESQAFVSAPDRSLEEFFFNLAREYLFIDEFLREPHSELSRNSVCLFRDRVNTGFNWSSFLPLEILLLTSRMLFHHILNPVSVTYPCAVVTTKNLADDEVDYLTQPYVIHHQNNHYRVAFYESEPPSTLSLRINSTDSPPPAPNSKDSATSDSFDDNAEFNETVELLVSKYQDQTSLHQQRMLLSQTPAQKQNSGLVSRDSSACSQETTAFAFDLSEFWTPPIMITTELEPCEPYTTKRQLSDSPPLISERHAYLIEQEQQINRQIAEYERHIQEIQLEKEYMMSQYAADSYTSNMLKEYEQQQHDLRQSIAELRTKPRPII